MASSHDRERERAMDLAEESREAEWTYPSFVEELFHGNFRWDLLHPFPEQSPEDKRTGDEYINKIRRVLEAYIDPCEVDRSGEIPEEALLALADAGAFGLKIPREYGGLGMSQTNYNRIMEFIASYCTSTAVCLSAHQSIGVPQPLKLFGSEEQKKKYLPRLAKGAVSAFALTEPQVGSDPAKMRTRAELSEDGTYYTINGEKLWCTNGPCAEILVVMALTAPRIVRGRERPQVTAFIVESSEPGFEVVHRCSFMGIRGISNGLLRFTNVKVPAGNIIGQPGQGLKIALTTLNTGRLTVPAAAVAVGKACMHFSQKWINERVQWGAPIGKHQPVARMIADMAADTFAMDSVNTLACAMVDQGGVDVRLEAAMAKYYCSETAWRLVDDFLQVRGGRGFETAESLGMRGEEPIPTERMLRDARISRIIEGTTEIMRLFIAREALDAHVRRIMPLMTGKGPRGRLFWDAVKFYARWYPRLWLPSAVSLNVRNLTPRNQDHVLYIARASRKLARTLFHTMAKYRQKLEREQLILQAFVDIGTDLFAMAAALSRAEFELKAYAGDETLQDLVDLFCTNARRRIRDNFRKAKQTRGRAISRVANAFMAGKYRWMITDVYTDFPPASRPARMTRPVELKRPETPAPQTEEHESPVANP
ncbi:MAG TPA: acyl-CoA dehydrogenase family protein [Candidatus Hydrogenedentes bacterium]|nr:acyl-CoA dehydrogenase family protein [Candidatus Hydrogenedentota bacterium]HPJ98516.1 acyl-CoA dehydrogenase family protein [Candidatus Hydrogenedentota bacterium]